MFLRNEAISFCRCSRCIIFICRSLCDLQWRLQMGSFWKTNPFLGGYKGANEVF